MPAGLLRLANGDDYIGRMSDKIDMELPPVINEESFADLVRRYAGLVYSTAVRRLGNSALAEDIAQMVFIRLARKPPTVKSHAELAAWLHRTTVHVTIDLWRSETRRRSRELKSAIMETNASQSILWAEVGPKLDQALNQLRAEDRQALVLRFFSQKTMREVGSALGVSEDAAKMRVSRALERLRTQLGVGTTVALGDLLLENSAEAAPEHLVTRLTNIKFSTVARLAIRGGLFAALLNVSKWKLAMGAMAVAVTVGVLMNRTRYAIDQNPAASSMIAQANPEANQAGLAALQRLQAKAREIDPGSASSTTRAEKTIVFKAVDSVSGEGLAGIKIHLYVNGTGGRGKTLDLLTDSAGAAIIPRQPPPNGENIFVSEPGYVPKSIACQHSPIADYTMKLDRAVRASGWVVDEQGQPVTNATLQLENSERINEVENKDFQLSIATSDDTGHWTYDYVPEDYGDTLVFILAKKGHATTYPWVPVAHTGLTNLVFVIDDGATVMGQVTDLQNQPVASATIRVLTAEPGKQQSAVTDEKGIFSLVGVAGESEFSHTPSPSTNESGFFVLRGQIPDGPRHVDLSVQADGFAAQKTTLTLSETTNEANFKLAPGNIFRGRIVDETGAPISNAIVQSDWNNRGVRNYVWSVHTGSNGRFEWDSAPAEPSLFWIEADGYQVQRGTSLIADSSDHQITLLKNQDGH